MVWLHFCHTFRLESCPCHTIPCHTFPGFPLLVFSVPPAGPRNFETLCHTCHTIRFRFKACHTIPSHTIPGQSWMVKRYYATNLLCVYQTSEFSCKGARTWKLSYRPGPYWLRDFPDSPGNGFSKTKCSFRGNIVRVPPLIDVKYNFSEIWHISFLLKSHKNIKIVEIR